MNLTEYLKANKMAASHLAEKSGVTVAMVTRFLRRERGLSPRTAARISSATSGEVTICELLFPDGLPEEAPSAKIA